MINRFIRVTDGLYRGSAPSASDIIKLKKRFGIKKIVSLDKETGDKIDEVCKGLNIKHVMIPLDGRRRSLLEFLKHDLKDLFLKDGPVFVHCLHGKDRTGFAVALVQCKYLGKDPKEALKEAKDLGFGLNTDIEYMHILEDLILKCKPSKDSNDADIVELQREYRADNRSSPLDEARQSSFVPYSDPTKQYPFDYVYNAINDQSPTRENYTSRRQRIIDRIITLLKLLNGDGSGVENGGAVPVTGLFNNDAGGRGFGPVENYSGFFYD
jgi:hypothetical protein